MSSKISIYNLKDQKDNHYVLITNDCRCLTESEGEDNRVDDNINNNITNIIPIISIKSKNKKKHKKNKSNKLNNNNYNNDFGLEDALDNSENLKEDNINRTNSGTKLNIFNKEDLEDKSSAPLSLSDVVSFYDQKDFNKDSSDVIKIIDRDAKLEDTNNLLFRKIITTKYNSCIGWIKNESNCPGDNQDLKIAILVKDFKDLREIINKSGELISSKKPNGNKYVFDILISDDATRNYCDSELILLKILLINLFTSAAYQLSIENLKEQFSEKNIKPKVEVRGASKLLNQKTSKNKNLNNDNNILSFFYQNESDASKLFLASKKFKGEKNRNSILKTSSFLKKSFFKENNILKLPIKPFVESYAIVRTFDPITNNNKDAEQFNRLVEDIDYIHYSNYLDFSDINNSDKSNNNDNKKDPIITVRLNIKFDESESDIHNKDIDEQNNNNTNIKIQNNNSASQNEELMGSSEIDFD